MNFGDIIELGRWEVTRVPGGWIFLHYGATGKATTFVPYDSEFDQRKPEPTPIPSSGDRTNTGF